MGNGTTRTAAEINQIRMIDQKARKEIIEETGKSFFISAGAGAGKTTLLVSRIKEMLEKGVKNSNGCWIEVKPSEIVVITFTNAAAAEIRDRVAEALKSSSRQVNVDEMNISTIHSFCHTLISERQFDLGVGMSIELDENEDSYKAKSQFFDKYVSDNFLTDPQLLELNNIIGYSYKGYLKKTFLNLADREMAEYPSLKDLFPGTQTLIKDYDIADIYKMAYALVPKVVTAICDPVKLAQNMGGLISGTITSLPTNLSSMLDELYSAFRKSIEEAISAYKTQNYKECLSIIKISNSTLKKIYKTTGNFGKYSDDMAKAYHLIVDDVRQIYDEFMALKILSCALKIVDIYKAQRDPLKLSNDALLYRTAELMSKPDAVKYFQKKYKYLMVDEYQDTDDAQNALVWNLARDYDKEPPKPDANYILPDQGSALRKGALVVVGDEKQAIYRFRGADANLFTKMRMKMENSSKTDPDVKIATLSINYRSNDKIINWANERFFDSVMKRMPEQEMIQSVERENYTVNTLQGVYKTDRDDAEELCKLIKELVDKGIEIVVKEKGNYIKRVIKYSDIMVLTYSKTNLPKYSDTLRKNGIPVRVTGTIDDGKLFSKKTGTVNELYCLVYKMKVLWDYLTDTENKAYYFNAVQVISGSEYYNEKNVSRYIKKKILKNFADKIKNLPSLGKLGYLIKHIEVLFPTLPDIMKDEDKIVNYRMLQSRLNNVYEYVLAKNPDSMQQVSEALKEYLSKSIEREAALEDNSNEVQLMNLHKAKGLQAPVVIVADRSKEDIYKFSNEYKEDLKFYPVITSGFDNSSMFNQTSFCSFATASVITQKAKDADQEDIDRKCYVEATRAGEVLIYMTPEDDRKKKPEERIIHMPNTPELLKDNDIYVQIANLTSGGVATTVTGAQSAATAPQTTQITVTEKEHYSPRDFCDSDDYKKKIDEIYKKENPSSFEEKSKKIRRDSKSEERPNGKVFGTVMHRSFELMANKLKKNEEEAKKSIRLIISLAMRESWTEIPADERKLFENYLNKQMEYFLADGNWLKEEILNAKAIHPEYEYSFMTSEKTNQAPGSVQAAGNEQYSGKNVWKNGTADLIIEKADGSILIVDYKSDDKSADFTTDSFKRNLMEKYSGQLAQYREAVEHIWNVTNIEAKIYSMYEML